MKKYLIKQKGKFYKANLHCHTTISDGSFTPEEIKKFYMEQGYSIVAYTDHDIFITHNDLTDENFLALNAHEIEVNELGEYKEGYMNKTYHFNYYAPSPDIEYSPVFAEEKVWGRAKNYITDEMRERQQVKYEYNVNTLNKINKFATEQGFLVSYNHPGWSLQNYSDYIGLENIWGLEVLNYSSIAEGYLEYSNVLDDFNRAGKKVFALATDDNHRMKDMFGGFVMIKADALEYGKIFKSLKDGEFYASEGPEIKSLYIENNVVKMNTGKVVRVVMAGDHRFSRYAIAENGKSLTHVEFDINDLIKHANVNGKPLEDTYFRIEIVDKTGKKAYTRCYYANEFVK